MSGGPVALRDSEAGFSATWEFAGPIIPAQALPGPCTVVLRGALDTATHMQGDVTIITGVVDPSSDSGYTVIRGRFEGTRSQ